MNPDDVYDLMKGYGFVQGPKMAFVQETNPDGPKIPFDTIYKMVQQEGNVLSFLRQWIKQNAPKQEVEPVKKEKRVNPNLPPEEPVVAPTVNSIEQQIEALEKQKKAIVDSVEAAVDQALSSCVSLLKLYETLNNYGLGDYSTNIQNTKTALEHITKNQKEKKNAQRPRSVKRTN